MWTVVLTKPHDLVFMDVFESFSPAFRLFNNLKGQDVELIFCVPEVDCFDNRFFVEKFPDSKHEWQVFQVSPGTVHTVKVDTVEDCDNREQAIHAWKQRQIRFLESKDIDP